MLVIQVGSSAELDGGVGKGFLVNVKGGGKITSRGIDEDVMRTTAFPGGNRPHGALIMIAVVIIKSLMKLN